MPLYEYYCENCRKKFERIATQKDSENVTCPKCSGKGARKLISCFRVGGQGDLRESTQHGCHGCYSGIPGHSHGKPSGNGGEFGGD